MAKGIRKKKEIQTENSSIEKQEEGITETDSNSSLEPLQQPKMEEVIQVQPKKLSVQAEKWRAYLPMQGLTPERFLQKYPNHPSRRYVEELLSFLQNKSI